MAKTEEKDELLFYKQRFEESKDVLTDMESLLRDLVYLVNNPIKPDIDQEPVLTKADEYFKVMKELRHEMP